MMGALQPKLQAQLGWALVIFGLPWSHAAMSLGTAWVGVCALMAWWQAGLALNLSRPIGTSPWLWLIMLLGWETGSLAWSDHVDWGLHQLSIQSSLLVLALAWLIVPLKRKEHLQTWVFQSAALAMIGVLAWGAWRTLDGTLLQGRDWTPWTSHIRLSMLIALGMVWGDHQPKSWRLAYLGLWVAFTAVTGSFTSALLIPLALVWKLWNATHGALRRRLASAFVAGTFGVIFLTSQWLQVAPLPSPINELPTHTSWGNPYVHRPESTLSEGDHRVHLFWCEQEWATAWNQVSEMPLDQRDSQGFTNRDRLPRYLASLGWPKDGEHILQLSDRDVAAIESGATHHIPRTGLLLRLREFKREWEVWQAGGNPTGHALFQRVEHWTAGRRAWLAAPWFGHGVGDVPVAMERAYEDVGSKLAEGHRHRSHNQHLTWGISTGFIGLILWIGLWAVWLRSCMPDNKHALWGGVVLALSCVFEDTLETQAGVILSFLALFACLRPRR